MNILVLNESPHADGNTSAMVNAFAEGAESNHHKVTVIPAALKTTDLLVFASPGVLLVVSGQLQSVVSRFYPMDPVRVKNAFCFFVLPGQMFMTHPFPNIGVCFVILVRKMREFGASLWVCKNRFSNNLGGFTK